MRCFAITMMAAIVCTASATFAQEVGKSATTIQTFTLHDYRGKPHSLKDLDDHQLIVVAFLGTECPLAKLYATKLSRLHETYESRGVAFLGIDPNRQDSLTEIAAYARLHDLKFPILKDLLNKVADHFGVERTPEVFVLDQQRKVCYRGRIDDQYAVGVKRDAASRSDLQIALDELLAGKTVSQPQTLAPGCLIGRTRPPKADAKVTYSNQISRIFQKRCVECHREGQIAPFALTEYEEVAGWADMIGEVVEDSRMPPWHADRRHGHFENSRRLTDEEKQLIKQWVADGAPEGDAMQLPENQTYTTGWQLPREPDLVLEMSKEPFKVAAEGRIRYQYFTVDPGLTKDVWVEAAQVIPGNTAVVHHILVAAQPKSMGDADHLIDIRGYLASYVPGLAPKPYPQGMAKRIPAGSLITFQVHYTVVGSEQTDLSKIGLLLVDAKEVTHEVRTTSALQPDLSIPPGVRNHRVDAYSPPSTASLQLLSMLPHMHARGKSFQYEAVYPNGRKEVLLRIPQYDFNWQTSYHLAEAKMLPPGTRIHCTAHFDNSRHNVHNPDPGETVKWGSQAWDEMMIGYFDVAMAR